MNASTCTKAPRKWDGEIDIARHHDTWLAFESDIHQSAALRARVARSLDRYGLGTSDVAVEGALDYLTRKELGASARYSTAAARPSLTSSRSPTPSSVSWPARSSNGTSPTPRLTTRTTTTTTRPTPAV